MTELPKAEKLGYSIAEACSALGLGKTTLYKHIAAGRLQAVRVGRRTIIPTRGLLALIGEGATNDKTENDVGLTLDR